MDRADLMLEAYARQISNEMGTNGTTGTSQLMRHGQRLFPAHNFLGVFPAKVHPPRTGERCFYICNTAEEAGANAHWMAIGRWPGRDDILFDSFGRVPSLEFQSHLMGLKTSDPDVNQSWEDTRCGQLCLAWGKCLINHGYELASQV